MPHDTLHRYRRWAAALALSGCTIGCSFDLNELRALASPDLEVDASARLRDDAAGQVPDASDPVSLDGSPGDARDAGALDAAADANIDGAADDATTPDPDLCGNGSVDPPEFCDGDTVDCSQVADYFLPGVQVTCPQSCERPDLVGCVGAQSAPVITAPTDYCALLETQWKSVTITYAGIPGGPAAETDLHETSACSAAFAAGTASVAGYPQTIPLGAVDTDHTIEHVFPYTWYQLDARLTGGDPSLHPTVTRYFRTAHAPLNTFDDDFEHAAHGVVQTAGMPAVRWHDWELLDGDFEVAAHDVMRAWNGASTLALGAPAAAGTVLIQAGNAVSPLTIIGDDSWSNYRFSVTVGKAPVDNDEIEIWVRGQRGSGTTQFANGYKLWLGGGGGNSSVIGLERIDTGIRTVLLDDTTAVPGSVDIDSAALNAWASANGFSKSNGVAEHARVEIEAIHNPDLATNTITFYVSPAQTTTLAQVDRAAIGSAAGNTLRIRMTDSAYVTGAVGVGFFSQSGWIDDAQVVAISP